MVRRAGKASARARDSSTTTITVSASIAAGWHIFSVDQPAGGPVATRVSLDSVATRPRLPAPSLQPRATRQFDSSFRMNVAMHEHAVAFSVPIAIGSRYARFYRGRGAVSGLQSDVCYPPQTTHLSQHDARGLTSVDESSSDATPVYSLAFVSLAASAGALSLLTPCVFPMVPITVSYLCSNARDPTKRLANRRALRRWHRRDIHRARADRLGDRSAPAVSLGSPPNPWVNLFGRRDLRRARTQSPRILLSARPVRAAQCVDAATRIHARRSRALLLMGTLFTLTSFTCTAPFIATLLVAASRVNGSVPSLGCSFIPLSSRAIRRARARAVGDRALSRRRRVARQAQRRHGIRRARRRGEVRLQRRSRLGLERRYTRRGSLRMDLSRARYDVLPARRIPSSARSAEARASSTLATPSATSAARARSALSSFSSSACGSPPVSPAGRSARSSHFFRRPTARR